MVYWMVLVAMVTVSRCPCSFSQSISINPSSTTFKLKGQSVTFTCQANGLVNPSYYWLKDGLNVTKGTTGTSGSGVYLTISSLAFNDAGDYACRGVSNSNILTSAAVQLLVQGSPQIIQPPSSLTSHVGYTVLFTCVAMASPSPVLSWYFNNGKLISSGGRYMVYNNGTLRISSLIKGDSGSYSCKVKNSFGETNAFADLTVLDPPTVPHFTTTPNNVTAKEKGEATFYCEASGIPSPTINWTRIGAAMPASRLSQPRPGALRIFSLIPSDTGLYACVAKNSQGQTIAYVYLGIEGFPRFVVSPSNKEIKESNSVSFSCVTRSDPKAKIAWQLPNGNTISSLTNPAGHIHVLANDTLVIVAVQERDQGIYKCIAKNSAGTKEAQAKLSVLRTPRFTTQLQNITKTRGNSLVVTCPARANPFPHFQWLFGGKIVSTDETLRLVPVNVSNQGYYTCRVNNTLGIATGKFYLRIFVSPAFTLSPSNQVSGIGAAVSFSCQAMGDPNPTITWYKSGVIIRPGPRYSILSNGTLVIRQAIRNDQGWFTCRSSNAAGTVEAKAYLRITDPPKFTALPSNKTADLGDRVVLPCRASAQEKPVMTWYKVLQDGGLHKVSSALVQSSGDLQINAVQRSDRSRYTCKACNVAGCVAAPVVMLNVLYMPSFLVPPKNVGVLKGQDAVLRCEPEASPRATITWRNPNDEVFGGTEYQQIIRNVQPSKTGAYKCEARNRLGRAGPVDIILSIQTKSVITDMTKVSSGSTVTVTCKVQGIPTPSIVWYIDKIALPDNAMYPSYTITRDKLQVPIGSLDEKVFSCNATNPQNSEVYFAKAPGAPTSLAVSDTTSNSLVLSWSRPMPGELYVTRYQLEVTVANSSWTVVSNNTKGLSYLVNKLSPFTWHAFRLKAFNGLGTSNYSVTSHSVRTLSSSPSPPQSLALHVAGTSTIDVTWVAPKELNGPLHDIKYRLAYDPKLPNVTNVFNVTHDTRIGLQEYRIADLRADVRYSVSVVAWRVRTEDGEVLQSKPTLAVATTLQIVPKTPPISLVVTSNGPYQIITKWQKPPYSVRGYNIWFKESVPGVNYSKINLADGAATSYVIMDLKENTVYLAKIQMYSNVADLGPFSKVYEVRTETDSFAAIAAQAQGSRSISWEVAVGGLVCGVVLLVLVVVTAWCLWKNTQKTNQTFRISARRRRRPSDPTASSFTSEGTTHGIYNIGAFNPELDHGLDLGMFDNDLYAMPITTSTINEPAPSDFESRDASDNPQNGSLYTSVQIEIPSDNGTQNNNEEPLHQVPVYSQVDLSKKTKKPQPVVNELPDLDISDSDSDENISEVPYPEDDLQRMERTWTNVSDFNFPPPPNVPPPLEPPSYKENSNEDERLNSILGRQEEPINDFVGAKGEEPGTKRMVATWADTPEEATGNLWETVDKELDRRLGTT